MDKWGPGGPAYALNERQGAQPHFIDLCAVLGVPPPGTSDDYVFERDTLVLGQTRGFADVFKRDHFAWENKAPNRNLDHALRQLLTYSPALGNPPLLVVCDRLTIRIHTQFNGHPTETFEVRLNELDQPEKQSLLRALWLDPERFRPRKTTRDITEAAARSFATMAEQLRGRGNDPEDVAHFLTQCLFCFFAEDVGLLPDRMFERLVNNQKLTSEVLTRGLADLFTTMRDGGLYGPDEIPWFNGGLFAKVRVPLLQSADVTELRNAARLNWSAIDVSIFGTLFERGLDPSKRAQLGAHYTDPSTILRLVKPVVLQPLWDEWEKEKAKIERHLRKRDELRARASTERNSAVYGRIRTNANAEERKAKDTFNLFLERIKAYRILDPACGSGNFLFLSLKELKDLEHRCHLEATTLGLDRPQDLVSGPQNVLGVELNEYAAELARVTVWIGELQWRLSHGYDFKTNPVLEPLDNIECRDALLCAEATAAGETFSEASWPLASVIVGNPPFLGDKKMRKELGDRYTNALRSVYAGRVPGGADLVTYWFEKARAEIELRGVGAAGLVATNSIRQVANRRVLDRVVETSRIFEAWSDEEWVNEGAAVRVSLICQGRAQGAAHLNGREVARINSDLTDGSNGLDVTAAMPLPENQNASFFGLSLAGPFAIEGSLARQWLRQGGNPNGRPNSDVLRPIWNGIDVTKRARDRWVIDFGMMEEDEASMYQAPFEYVRQVVQPTRAGNREAVRAHKWWRHGRPRPELRTALSPLSRFIVTSETSKHRFFVWCPKSVAPEHKLVVIPRDDDVTFGILSSRIHVSWVLAAGSTLEDRPVYTTGRVLEPFPFPAGLTLATLPSEYRNAHAEEIGHAAARLDQLRNAWLNPPEWVDFVAEQIQPSAPSAPYPARVVAKPGHLEDVASRTLTQLYNDMPAWLKNAHEHVDRAVARAYGWEDYAPSMPDDVIRARLLALNSLRLNE